jgi:hypothetical protein
MASPRNSAAAVSGPIYRALIRVGRAERGADVIVYEGKFWVVTDWLVTTDKRRPLRIVSLTGIPHEGSPTDPPPQFVVSAQLPVALFAPAPLPSKLRRLYRIVASLPHQTLSTRTIVAPKTTC